MTFAAAILLSTTLRRYLGRSVKATDALRLVEADLISGIVELSRYATHGTPEAVQVPQSRAPAELDQLLSLVEPSDLLFAKDLWARAQAIHRKNREITWGALLAGASVEAKRFADFAQEYGMGVAYQALLAAKRIMAYRGATQRLSEAQRAAAQALEESRVAMRGVAG